MAESKKDLNTVLQGVLQGIIRKHKRILFDGDNYTDEWKAEAAKRGLPNLVKTPEALATLEDKKTISLLEKYGVFSARETKSRYEVYMHTYHQVVSLEGLCALRMARTMVLPAVYRYLAELGATQAVLPKGFSAGIPETIKQVASLAGELNGDCTKLEQTVHAHDADATLEAMAAMRKIVDALENLSPANLWPLPSYAEMLFVM
jgi:glutamine synthetase